MREGTKEGNKGLNEITEKKFKVNRIVYFNKDTKWGVLGTSPIDDLGDLKLQLMNDFANITIAGSFSGVYEGAEIIVSGNVIENPKYGKQIQITEIKVIQDTESREGVISFLAKSEIGGISVQNASKIYAKYGKKSIDVVFNNPEELVTINGIGIKTIEKIKASVQEYKDNEEFYKYVASIGINYTTSRKILKEFGSKALEKIKKNPYEILEVSALISFKQVDEIYLKQGGSPDSIVRLGTGLLYMLKKLAVLEGSTGTATIYLKGKFYELLKMAPESQNFESTIRRLKNKNKIVTKDNHVFYKEYLDMEHDIASKLTILEQEGRCSIPCSLEIIEDEMKNFPFKLNVQQKKAINDCLDHNVAVLTGAGGTGKTSITKALYRIYKRCGYNVQLLSPTAKAVRRLEECTGGQAQTIHKFLGMSKEGRMRETRSYEDNTVLIIDEASMLDIILFSNLLAGVSMTTRILLVGDNNQLPSVQAGNVLGDVISSNKIHVSLLTDIMRQKESSNIIRYCSMINAGEIMEPCDHDDFHYEEFGTAQELKDKFFIKYMEMVKAYGLNEVQVITPYKKGEIGMDNLNLMLQKVYQDVVQGQVVMEPYRKYDRVRHTVNNYEKEVFNGEVGIVEKLEDDEMVVNYGNKLISYDEKGLEELTLSYAATVHSSQGSEYKVVFVILDDTSANHFLHIRRLLYTAVSRGKEKVFIYSKPYLVDTCISDDSYRPRVTRLEEFLLNPEGEY